MNNPKGKNIGELKKKYTRGTQFYRWRGIFVGGVLIYSIASYAFFWWKGFPGVDYMHSAISKEKERKAERKERLEQIVKRREEYEKRMSKTDPRQ